MGNNLELTADSLSKLTTEVNSKIINQGYRPRSGIQMRWVEHKGSHSVQYYTTVTEVVAVKCAEKDSSWCVLDV